MTSLHDVEDYEAAETSSKETHGDKDKAGITDSLNGLDYVFLSVSDYDSATPSCERRLELSYEDIHFYCHGVTVHANLVFRGF